MKFFLTSCSKIIKTPVAVRNRLNFFYQFDDKYSEFNRTGDILSKSNIYHRPFLVQK